MGRGSAETPRSVGSYNVCQSCLYQIAKKMITIIAIVAIGGYILICAALYFLQERLIFYPEVLAPDFTFTFPGRFEEIALPSDSAVISALYFKADHPKGVGSTFTATPAACGAGAPSPIRSSSAATTC